MRQGRSWETTVALEVRTSLISLHERLADLIAIDKEREEAGAAAASYMMAAVQGPPGSFQGAFAQTLAQYERGVALSALADRTINEALKLANAIECGVDPLTDPIKPIRSNLEDLTHPPPTS